MHLSPPKSVRFFTASLILLFSLAALYPLTIRLLAQLHVNSAEKNIIALQYTTALSELNKAVGLQPKEFQIHNQLGNVYYKLGSSSKDSNAALQWLVKARDHFQQALQLHPLDARSAYGLARTEIYIEKNNYLSGKGSSSPEDSPALHALEQAIALRPASTIYRLAYARYLYLHDETDKLLSEMRNLGRLQPSIYGTLRGEEFWSPAARREFFAGVKQALTQGITPRQSFLVAAGIMAEEKNWTEALSFRQQGMAVQSSLNLSGDFIRLGSLYLMADEPDQASENFFQALTISNDIEKDIIAIMRVCRNAGNPDSMMSFYRQSGKLYGNSSQMDIAAARYLFDLKNYEQAKTVLSESVSQHQNGEAYYWLSRIAEAQQDWDAFELAIQKATLHDPQNANYHLRFSQVLNRLQKYERAEKEAGLAIKFNNKPNISLYTFRAGLRNRLKDYQGALEDWLQAISLDPGKGSYYYQAGDLSEKMARIDEAAEYFQKAIELEPENKTYAQRLERIEKKYGVKQ
jgi:tetratricopeptide (TPR) repeat protein